MSLAPGSRIGVYDVVEMIGVGGMGEVYRARDSRLERDVALKTLPDEFARDAERLARFEREAKSLAQLNHPHIASIYGLETGSPTALAMEMVEGETLADRLKAGPLPLDEALIIARQLCAALDHAHGRGIVHRDLKPANIKAGPRDAAPHVKVLDFGLAKAMLPDALTGMPSSVVSSPTITSPANMTRAGVILGTAAYMAPTTRRRPFVSASRCPTGGRWLASTPSAAPAMRSPPTVRSWQWSSRRAARAACSFGASTRRPFGS